MEEVCFDDYAELSSTKKISLGSIAKGYLGHSIWETRVITRRWMYCVER